MSGVAKLTLYLLLSGGIPVLVAYLVTELRRWRREARRLAGTPGAWDEDGYCLTCGGGPDETGAAMPYRHTATCDRAPRAPWVPPPAIKGVDPIDFGNLQKEHDGWRAAAQLAATKLEEAQQAQHSMMVALAEAVGEGERTTPVTWQELVDRARVHREQLAQLAPQD